jgi:non-specific serine/threonine protein kinase/serine/threonine-protein kinase
MSRRAKDIFLDALDVPLDQRQRFVDSTCGDDAQLREAVLKLLGDHDRLGGSFLQSPAARGVASEWVSSTLDGQTPTATASHADDESPGAIVGVRYRLDRKLGEGGFGTVWLARQIEPIDRNVAVKILKPGLTSSRQIAARFEAERQTLARMDHPGIARVLDAGATATGRPYFVMEFVADALPITDYAKQHRVPLRERVRLVERVCLAVQHAHTKGVIHRDIKPGNVLVSTSTGSAAPRVIDFGIAKAIDNTSAGLTQDLQIIGTPQYMSPEQAAGASRLVDTRSDVYSLGALLYELACGAAPFDADELRKMGWTDAMKKLREVDPPAPSSRVSEPIDAEVDWIALRALEKDPARRYQSAAEMAADLQRYLAGRAVEAGPATRAYQLRKFVARHKVAIAALGSVAAALLIASSVSVAALINARRAERAAQRQEIAAKQSEDEAVAAERDATASAEVARQNLGRATALADFTGKLVRGIDPSVAQGSDTTVMREVLADASKRLDERADSLDAAVHVSLRGMIGEAYLAMGLVDESLREFRKTSPSTDANSADRDAGESPERLVHVIAAEAYAKTRDFARARVHVDAARALKEGRPMATSMAQRLDAVEASIRAAERH